MVEREGAAEPREAGLPQNATAAPGAGVAGTARHQVAGARGGKGTPAGNRPHRASPVPRETKGAPATSGQAAWQGPDASRGPRGVAAARGNSAGCRKRICPAVAWPRAGSGCGSAGSRVGWKVLWSGGLACARGTDFQGPCRCDGRVRSCFRGPRRRAPKRGDAQRAVLPRRSVGRPARSGEPRGSISGGPGTRARPGPVRPGL